MSEPRERQGLELFNRALKLSRAGRYRESAALFQEVITAEPDWAQAHHNLAHALNRLGDSETACHEYRAAIACDPRLIRAYNDLGIALRKSGRVAEAVAIYREGLGIAPKQASLWNNLGSALEATGARDLAAEHYRHAVGCDPTLVISWVNLARVYNALERFAEAEDAASNALARDPEHSMAVFELCSSLTLQGKSDHAIPTLQRYLKRAPADTEALVLLGLCLYQRGAHARSREDCIAASSALFRALLRRPTHAGARAALGTMAEALGKAAPPFLRWFRRWAPPDEQTSSSG